MLIHVISPIATNLGIQKMLGELTLTILAVFLILLIIVLLGLLMQINSVAGIGKKMEDIAFRIFPSLNQVKLLAAEKLDFDSQSTNWKSVLIYFEEKYSPAFLVEEKDDLQTFFVMKGTTLEDGEILITTKKSVTLIEISSVQLHQYCRQFGKGFLPLIPSATSK
ncbi:hypothetical protein [Chitinophaga sp.]|uniref:hypothetical protein n=1 Tax=Chitinophaga sp. TaxID=1869181 RepID=UPI002F953FB9